MRVAAILEAGIAVFSEKGYDAATMTEIAARSNTAIGSLYRFFPSKESLADALLSRYVQHAESGFTALASQASAMTPGELADAFVDFMVSLQSQRSLAVALVDARGGSDERRARFRETTRGAVAAILRNAIPHLTKAQSETMAIVLLHVLKAVAGANDEKPAARRKLLAEIRKLARVYLETAQSDAAGRLSDE
nr:TetR/AcrR family transcriptional regulator [Paraburkholderia caffeinilytica]